MAGKVLKIDVVVDENGTARRALTEIEGGVKKVETAGQLAASGLSELDKKLLAWDERLEELENSLGGMGTAAATSATEMVGLSLGIGAVLTIAGAAGAAIFALGTFVKDATEYYVEQSGVLEVNRAEVDALAKSWDMVKYAIGEVIVGGDGDYRSWVNMVHAGLIMIGAQLAADIELYKQLGNLAGKFLAGRHLDPTDPGDLPGVDTTRFNPDGSPTPYELMRRQRERNGQPGGPFGTSDGGYEPFSATQAEAMTMAELSRLKQEQLALEREQKKEAAERLRLANEQVKLENDLTQALERSRMQYEREIDAATRLNEKTKERIDMQVRDSFMKGTLGGDDYKRYQIGADADRKLATIDPRTDNASELARRYVAERELALIQLRQSSEGFTQAVSDDLNHFRAEFADVVGQLPQEFQQIIPPVLAASGELREGMTADLAQIRTQTGFVSQGFVGLGSTVRATKEQIAKGLQEVEDAYMRAGFVIQRDAGVSRLRGAQTGGLLFGAGGYVEPTYLARGGPAGTDTIPAWLTPGEGVLSRTGMSALDRLNSGIASMGSSRGAPMVFNAPLVDARGAQFTDERAIDALADRVQQRLALLNTRWGGTA